MTTGQTQGPVTLAVSTIGARVLGIDPTPPAGVRRLVIVQSPAPEADAHLARIKAQGSEVIVLEGRGVAKSRNAALRAVQGGILLFGDDDVALNPQAPAALATIFGSNPDMALYCGRLCDETGHPHKTYGRVDAPMRLWNIGKIGTPELAVRIEAVRAKGLFFDESFGAGTPQPFGEEFIFAADALRAGLQGLHGDLVIGQHPRESSGLRRDAAAEAVRRAVFRRALGLWGHLGWVAYRARHRLQQR